MKYLLIIAVVFVSTISNAQTARTPKPVMWWNFDGVKMVDSFTIHFNKWTGQYVAQVSCTRYDGGVVTRPDKNNKIFICYYDTVKLDKIRWRGGQSIKYFLTWEINEAIKTYSKESAIVLIEEYIKEKKTNQDRKRDQIIEARRQSRYYDSLEKVRKDFQPIKNQQ
jgi:hypothetical protein